MISCCYFLLNLIIVHFFALVFLILNLIDHLKRFYFLIFEYFFLNHKKVYEFNHKNFSTVNKKEINRINQFSKKNKKENEILEIPSGNLGIRKRKLFQVNFFISWEEFYSVFNKCQAIEKTKRNHNQIENKIVLVDKKKKEWMKNKVINEITCWFGSNYVNNVFRTFEFKIENNKVFIRTEKFLNWICLEPKNFQKNRTELFTRIYAMEFKRKSDLTYILGKNELNGKFLKEFLHKSIEKSPNETEGRIITHRMSSIEEKTLWNQRNSCRKDLKRPIHIGIIANNYNFQCKKVLDALVTVILYCIMENVPYVSIYDRKGELGCLKKLLRKELNEKLIKYRLKFLISKIIVCSPSTSKRLFNEEMHRHKVIVIKEKNGKEDLIRITKQLCSENQSPINIDREKIESLLCGFELFPDPDVLFVFGPILCLSGYLPWQTRLSEIIHLGTLYWLPYSFIKDALLLYSKIQQRYGT